MSARKSKIAMFCSLFVLFQFVAKSQISTDELPISFRYNEETFRMNKEMLKTMLPIDLEKLRAEDEIDEAVGIPPRFGYPHEVNFSLENSGEWFDLPNGDKLWQLEIYSPGALSINLLYDKFWLPDGAKFFIYSSNKRHSIGAFTSINNKGNRENPEGFATGLIYGDRIVLEYYLPKNVSEQGIISICNVVHGYRYININNFDNGKKDGNSFQSFGSSGSCQVNINCSPEGDNWQSEKNAVALIIVNGTRWCTGSLINNTNKDYTPYFLTANHCLGSNDAINNPNLNHWSFLWHYESPNCNNINGPIISTARAIVVANNAASDFALLRLDEDPRNKTGVHPYYLGWDRTGNSGTGGVGIHHPRGDIKKISTYTMQPNSTNYLSNTINSSGSHWRVIWVRTTNEHSVTEGGSSGSPLINSNRRIIGQLHGGYADCVERTSGGGQFGKNEPDWYGKFSLSWTGNNATDSRRRLRDHLNPSNNVSVLDGACWSILVTGTRPPPSLTTRIVECREITVQDATVPTGTTLDLKATDRVIINPGFTVQSGASFIIR